MAKLVHKVVPILLRRRERLEILAFRHPQAGTQLVKGTLENGEKAEDATLRELAEESGIEKRYRCKAAGSVDLAGNSTALASLSVSRTGPTAGPVVLLHTR